MPRRASWRKAPLVQVLRRLDPAVRRLLIVLLAVGLLSRALVPAGWMPVAGASGVLLVPCDGAGPARAGHHAGVMHHGGRHDAPGNHDAGSHPCVFADVTPALDTPMIAAPFPPAAVPLAFALFRALASVGGGLAAPPPPSTGPPLPN